MVRGDGRDGYLLFGVGPALREDRARGWHVPEWCVRIRRRRHAHCLWNVRRMSCNAHVILSFPPRDLSSASSNARVPSLHPRLHRPIVPPLPSSLPSPHHLSTEHAFFECFLLYSPCFFRVCSPHPLPPRTIIHIPHAAQYR